MVVRRLVAGLALVPVLVACSDTGGGEPSADPSEPTSSSTVEPTPTETERPEPATPAAAARLWFDLYNEASASGDTRALRERTAKACFTCGNLIKAIETVYGDGGLIDSPGWRIDEMRTQAKSDKGALVVLRVIEPAGSTTLRAGAAPKAFSERKDVFFLYLKRRTNRWVVANMVMEAQ